MFPRIPQHRNAEHKEDERSMQRHLRAQAEGENEGDLEGVAEKRGEPETQEK